MPTCRSLLVSDPVRLLAPDRRRMSRSVAKLVCSTNSSSFSVSNAATRACRAASFASGIPARCGLRPCVRPNSDEAPVGSGSSACTHTPAACAGRYPDPRRSLAAWHRGSTDTGQQLPPELLRVVLTSHDRGSSRFPGRGRIQRVQDQWSRPLGGQRCGGPSLSALVSPGRFAAPRASLHG